MKILHNQSLGATALVISFSMGFVACQGLYGSQTSTEFDLSASGLQTENCVQHCDQLLLRESQDANLHCRQQHQRCQENADSDLCSADYEECTAEVMEHQDKLDDEYNQCMESCYNAASVSKTHQQNNDEAEKADNTYDPARKSHGHGSHKSFKKCYRKCDREVSRCHDRGCRRDRKKCLREAYKIYPEWIESLKDQLEFCEVMFPDEPANLDDCIKGVLDGAAQPDPNLESCWQTSFACSQDCIGTFNTCIVDCL